MAKVTSKLQFTIPKAIADRYKIKPGDELEVREAGETIRLVPAGRERLSDRLTTAEKLEIFDAMTKRMEKYAAEWRKRGLKTNPKDRGWTRADLYHDRGRPR